MSGSGWREDSERKKGEEEEKREAEREYVVEGRNIFGGEQLGI